MKVFALAAALAALACLLPPVSPAEAPPPEAVTAAAAGLVRYLCEIPPQELVNFGFAAGEATAGAAIGDPWSLYAITPDALSATTSETEVADLITPTGLWYFPVILSGRPRCIITVDRMDGRWEAVGIGMAPLAGELDKIARQWPKTGGYTPQLVAVYQAAAYFFTVPEKDARNLTPLTFDGLGFGGYYQKALPEYSATAEFSEFLAPLKESVEANIAAHRASREGGEE